MTNEPDQFQIWRHYAAIFIERAAKSKLTDNEIEICLQYAEPLFLAKVPVIYSFDHFCRLVGYSHKYVVGAATATHKYYRYFEIPKRNGAVRSIAEPLPSLKEIQTWIYNNVLERLPVHSGAKAYVKNRSIRDNARFHRSQRYVLTIDIVEFFPSIRGNRIYPIFYKAGYSQQVSSIMTDLCCLHGRLPQGAPTSPSLSNLACVSLDRRLFNLARSLGLRYTRYADDITLSGIDVTRNLILKIYEILGEYGFEPNLKKTRVMKYDQRQEVTGVIVNNKLQASREYRLKVRQQAYYIKRYGLESHALYVGEMRRNFDKHLLGKANHIKFLNTKDPNAEYLIRALKNKNER